jgi:hypothetical protein
VKHNAKIEATVRAICAEYDIEIIPGTVYPLAMHQNRPRMASVRKSERLNALAIGQIPQRRFKTLLAQQRVRFSTF